MATTKELYEIAINKLQNYVNFEQNKQKRDAATSQIQQLRIAIQEDAFNEMSKRTQRLGELKSTLQDVINNAGDGSGVSGVIDELTSFLGTISQE